MSLINNKLNLDVHKPYTFLFMVLEQIHNPFQKPNKHWPGKAVFHYLVGMRVCTCLPFSSCHLPAQSVCISWWAPFSWPCSWAPHTPASTQSSLWSWPEKRIQCYHSPGSMHTWHKAAAFWWSTPLLKCALVHCPSCIKWLEEVSTHSFQIHEGAYECKIWEKGG